MLDNAVDTIKNSITMADVCRQYGIDIDNKGFACCPFHNEKTPSFKVYKGAGGYHCFGCGESGDVITFVMKYFDLPFKEALQKLDTDFSLGIYAEKTFEERRQIHFKQKAILSKRNREKAEKEAKERIFWQVFEEWKRLVDNRERYKPKSNSEELHPLFVESLQKLDYQEYLLSLAEEERRQYA